MAFTEVTTESWGGRLVKSIKSVLVGVVLFFVSFPVLFWNEGRAVQTAKSLEQGAQSVVSVPVERVDPSNEGKLVHLSGESKSDEKLVDPEFGVSAAAIKLKRRVEMYQWEEEKRVEEKKKVGGSVEKHTTYTYEKTWSDRLISSRDFKEAGHSNPSRMPYESKTLIAKHVTLGAFTLSSEQISQIDNDEGLAVDASAVENAPKQVRVNDGSFYLGDDPASPDIGDVRVGFEVVRPGPLSIVAVQAKASFVPWKAPAGDDILLVATKTQTAAQMFQAAQEANVMMTWILRLIGFVAMFVGLTMAFRPISVFGDVIPFVGSMLGAGLGLFSFLISAGLSFLTISTAWLFYRPVVGVLLFLVGGGAIFGLVWLASKRRRSKTAALTAR